jgi:phosphoglycolate phosphatase
MQAPTIIFDLDGTLVDTAPDLVETLNVILGREGLPAIAYDDARLLVGWGARRMIERGLESDGQKRRPGDVQRLFDDFIAYYADHVADRSRPFPGVIEALDTLAARGCRFAVCTNKLEWLSVRLLEALGLANRFVAICGQDTCAGPAAPSGGPSWWGIPRPISRPPRPPACPSSRSISAIRMFRSQSWVLTE